MIIVSETTRADRGQKNIVFKLNQWEKFTNS